MSDIAQRLLDGGNDICRDGPMWPGDDMLEGYAEITRLRAMVEDLKADRIRINDEAEAEIKRLRGALRSVLAACDKGKMVQRPGVGGQTIDAQIRASVYHDVAAWPIEEARAIAEGWE